MLVLWLLVLFLITVDARKRPYSLRSEMDVTHHDRVWAMKLAPSADPRLVAKRLHLVYVKQLFGGEYHVFREPHETGRDGMNRIAQEQVARGAERDNDVLWFEKQTFRRPEKRSLAAMKPRGTNITIGSLISPGTESILHLRYTRAIVETMKKRMEFDASKVASSNDPAYGPNPMTVRDPQYPNQWHLRAANPVSVKADAVWNMHQSFRGERAHIAIVDDGIHAMLPDMMTQVDVAMSGAFSYGGGTQVSYQRVHFFYLTI